MEWNIIYMAVWYFLKDLNSLPGGVLFEFYNYSAGNKADKTVLSKDFLGSQKTQGTTERNHIRSFGLY